MTTALTIPKTAAEDGLDREFHWLKLGLYLSWLSRRDGWPLSPKRFRSVIAHIRADRALQAFAKAHPDYIACWMARGDTEDSTEGETESK
jgi:hypothetical protein